MGRDAHRDGFHHAAQSVSVEQIYIQNAPAFEIIQHIGLGNHTIESYDCLNEAFTLCKNTIASNISLSRSGDGLYQDCQTLAAGA